MIPAKRSTLLRVAVPTIIILAIAVIAVSRGMLTERFTQTTRSRAEQRVTLYSANLVSELQRNAIVPQLLARDPALISALQNADYSQSTRRLISFLDEIGAASILLMDMDGRAVAATDRTRLGESHRSSAFFVDALRSNTTVFNQTELESGAFGFSYARRIEAGGRALGVIAVEINLSRMEQSWARSLDAVMVTDSAGQIILATDGRWRGLQEVAALERRAPPSALERALSAAQDWTTAAVADTYLAGQAMMRVERRVPFQGWRMVTFTPYASVRERVNGILALELMGFAILLAAVFFMLSRRAETVVTQVQQESADLRLLNQRLQHEIAARRKVEQSLEVAEQSLAQSSKLAALGEMSAAVSHELNQPLAAMKTYLAGARLLMERRRPDEAMAAFARIDDLIGRMGAITRQLKSYARKGSDEFQPVDVRAAVLSALSMMEPQLKTRDVSVSRILPDHPVMVMGDRVRIEQVIVNLLRNAFDATKSVDSARVDVILAQGDHVVITVRDNGQGIADLEALFEPFYTTKQPGDGVGLGLAISSGIVSDLGGRLTARHAAQGGAVFEVELPILDEAPMQVAE